MEWVYSHDFDDGLKLMEHSYIGNKFVGVVMKLLTKGNRWYKKPIVWCGDYYKDEKGKSYYEEVGEDNQLKPKEFLDENEQRKSILVNHTKKQYAVLSIQNLIKKRVVDRLEGNDDNWDINPLPLLTALGNGQGGGDYKGVNMDKIGIWARDVISVEFEIPKDYTELKIKFKEG